MRNKQLIRSTLIIFSVIYIAINLYLIIKGVAFTSVLHIIKSSLILTLACVGLGFSITLVVIVGTKNYLLSRVLKSNGNGRYSTTSGILPKVNIPSVAKINTEDLPPDIWTWIGSLAENDPIRDLFIECAGILKNNLLPSEIDNQITLFTHSISITQKLLEHANNGATYCSQQLEKYDYAPSHKNLSVINEILNSGLLPLIGISYDLGKIIAHKDNGKTISYTASYPQKTKIILGGLNNLWALPPLSRDALLFAVANYQDLKHVPKCAEGNKLVVKSMTGKVLAQLLRIAIYEVDGSVVSKSSKTPLAVKHPQIATHDNNNVQPLDDNSDVELPIDISNHKNKPRRHQEQVANPKLTLQPQKKNTTMQERTPKINQVFPKQEPVIAPDINSNQNKSKQDEPRLDTIFKGTAHE